MKQTPYRRPEGRETYIRQRKLVKERGRNEEGKYQTCIDIDNTVLANGLEDNQHDQKH